MSDNATLINQDSGKVEFYTPPEIVDAARRVMGAIDLDPASCEVANRTVKAARYFTKEDDGLKQSWSGRVWMNHPFKKYQNHLWINKLVSSYKDGDGDVIEALCICYASTTEKWFQPLLAYPQCFIHGRTDYLDETGKVKPGVTKGSVVTYLGSNRIAFHDVFKDIGTIKIKYQPWYED